MTPQEPARICTVEPLEGFVLRLTFSNGVVRTVDVGPLLRGPVFEPMRRDPAEFRKVAVDPEWDTVVWPNGADICPDVLYHGRAPAWAEGTPGKGTSP